MTKIAGTVARGAELHRRPDTRDRALHVAQALFAERGYRGTSLRDISRRIGIKAPSLLHHFSSKDELYLAVLERIFTRMEQAVGSILDGREAYQHRTRKLIEGSIDFLARHPDYSCIIWNALIDEKGVGRQLLKRRVPAVYTKLVNFVQQGQREGEFRPEVDPFHFLLIVSSVTFGYFSLATNVRRLWNIDLLDARTIETRKREVMELVARTLFRRERG